MFSIHVYVVNIANRRYGRIDCSICHLCRVNSLLLFDKFSERFDISVLISSVWTLKNIV